MPTIRVDDEVYAWLQKQARPFEDTPNSVLRRVASLDNLSEKGEKNMTVPLNKPRVIVGKKTPQSEFRKPILSVLKRFGGKGDRMRVLAEVEKLMAARLTAYDKEDIRSGTIRWQKSAEWEVRVMREQGILKPVSETPRGQWALTERGKAAADAP